MEPLWVGPIVFARSDPDLQRNPYNCPFWKAGRRRSLDSKCGGESPERVESGRPGDLDRAGLLPLPPLGPGHDHVNVAAAAFGADEPLAPFEDRGFRAVPLGHFRGVGLDPAAARLAPHDQPHGAASVEPRKPLIGPIGSACGIIARKRRIPRNPTRTRRFGRGSCLKTRRPTAALNAGNG
jgi:hypothetical protein